MEGMKDYPPQWRRDLDNWLPAVLPLITMTAAFLACLILL